jgi:dihydroorotase
MSQLRKISDYKLKFESLTGKILLKNVHVIDPSEKLNNTFHVVIAKGKIADLLQKVPKTFDGKIIEKVDSVLMPGLFDMHVHLREPGREDEETILSGSLAAANGGFTGVACMPNTQPPVDSQEVVNFIKEKAENLLVDVFPVATITNKREGIELSPIAELVEAGVIAISDDGSPVMNTQIMRRALEYSKMFAIPILAHEEDLNLTKDSFMHEGFYSTKLGIPAIPAIAEEILISRDIMLTQYTGGRLHVCHISTKGSIELIRQAKAKGISVTCEVTPHHFTLTDKAVESFDTNTKMNPPLRSEEDRQAILTALKEGTIDVIASDHAPHSIEEKETEFIHAPFGIIGMETSLGLILTELYNKGALQLKDIYAKCVFNPRKILNLPVPKIKKGEEANLTLFSLKKSWKLKDEKSFSKSNNTPFSDYTFTGKNILVINKGKIFYCE